MKRPLLLSLQQSTSALLGMLIAAALSLPGAPAAAALEQPGFVADRAPEAQTGNREYGRFLVLRPAEYSRYEISPDGHVVIYFPLGVEGWYMGYYLRAGQLRYDQATEVASLSGGVLFRMPGYAIACAALTLDGTTGSGEIPGTLSGVYDERGLYFQAGKAALSFPPGLARQEQNFSLSTISLDLRGGVRATDSLQNTLLTESLHFDGPGGRIHSGGEFDLLVSSKDTEPRPAPVQSGAYGPGAAPASSPAAGGPPAFVNSGKGGPPDFVTGAAGGPPPFVTGGAPPSFTDFSSIELFPLLVHGSRLEAVITREGGLGDLRVEQPLLRTSALVLSADLAVLNLPALTGDGGPESEPARLTGQPVQAILSQGPVRRVILQADLIAVQSLPDKGHRLLLEGNASIDAPEGRLAAGALNVTTKDESYSVDLPDGIDLDFNLSALGGSDLLSGAGD